MHSWEEEAIEQVRAECRIAADWQPRQFSGVFRLLDDVGRTTGVLAALTGHDEETIRQALIGQISFHYLPEDSIALTFASPDGEDSVLTVMSPRDQKAGTKAYLDRLDLDQLRYVSEEADRRIQAKTQEEKRTVWRVCDDSMCRGNFRDTQYLEAVAFMAEEGKRLYAEHEGKGASRPRDMRLELVPMRVAESEYESWFK